MRSGSYYGDLSPNKNKLNLAVVEPAHLNAQGKKPPIPGKAGTPPLDIHLDIK